MLQGMLIVLITLQLTAERVFYASRKILFTSESIYLTFNSVHHQSDIIRRLQSTLPLNDLVQLKHDCVGKLGLPFAIWVTAFLFSEVMSIWLMYILCIVDDSRDPHTQNSQT